MKQLQRLPSIPILLLRNRFQVIRENRPRASEHPIEVLEETSMKPNLLGRKRQHADLRPVELQVRLMGSTKGSLLNELTV